MNRYISSAARGFAVLTVAALVFAVLLPRAARGDTTFPQTDYSIWGPFETYWKAHGGLAQFGMPRTSVFPVTSKATKGGQYDAQWFERAQFTYNPSNPDPYKVQLQLLGSLLTAGRQNEQPFQRTAAMANPLSRYFDATGHNLSGKFLEYWNSHGGLPIYGYPISEQFTERSKSDGKEYVVQYFERNRFELHPELAGTQYEVQLGLLGSELLDAQGGPPAFSNLGPPLFYPPPSTPSSYPKMGHAPDYSWIAGQVQFTKIQGGCVFIRTTDESFAPSGSGWNDAKVQNGDYVVVFGHIAGPGEPIPVCPGGRPYIVDRTQLNP
jgi:hypothetical protein